MNPFDQIMGVLEASQKWGLPPREIIRLCAEGTVQAVQLDGGIGAWVLLKDQPAPGGFGQVDPAAQNRASPAKPGEKQAFMSTRLIDALYE